MIIRVQIDWKNLARFFFNLFYIKLSIPLHKFPCSINRNIDQDNDDQVTKNQEMTQNGQQMTKNGQQMTKNDNYVEMAPAHVSDDQLPLRPFEPIDYRNRKSVDIDEPVDPISIRLQVRFLTNTTSVAPVFISVIITYNTG